MIKRYQTKCSIDNYKLFLKEFIIGNDLYEEIIKQINIFDKDGNILIDGNDLYGKILNKDRNDYLEIKMDKDFFSCKYTKHNLGKVISINQSCIDNNVKVERYETTESNNSHGLIEKELIEIEKIYSDSKLIYESYNYYNHEYIISSNQIKYNDKGDYFNKMLVTKKWYFPNGSILYYDLNKNFIEENSTLKEKYSICVKPYMQNNIMIYDLENISENVFKKLLLGELSIENVVGMQKSKKRSV